MRTITLLCWSDKGHYPYNCLSLLDEDNSVSRTDNFVNANGFNGVTSSRVLSYRKSKLCKKRKINRSFSWRHHFLKSKTKDPPKFLSSSRKRGGIFISVYNFSAQYLTSFGNQSILNFRVMKVRDTRLRSNLLKNIYLSLDFEPF